MILCWVWSQGEIIEWVLEDSLRLLRKDLLGPSDGLTPSLVGNMK